MLIKLPYFSEKSAKMNPFDVFARTAEKVLKGNIVSEHL
jgi:hypothetical protein